MEKSEEIGGNWLTNRWKIDLVVEKNTLDVRNCKLITTEEF